MKIKFLSAVLLLLSFSIAEGQISMDKSNTTSGRSNGPIGKFDLDKLFFGGSIGGGYDVSNGYSSTSFEFSPAIGYELSENFRPGVGLSYQYWNFKSIQSNDAVKQSIVGGRIFASYELMAIQEGVIAYAEYESLRLTYDGRDLFMSNIWLGGGLRQRISDRVGIDMMLLYNANYQEGSVQEAFYGSPWTIKASLIVGL